MTLFKFFEGFDYWAGIGDGAGKGWSVSGAGGMAAGRFGGQSLGNNGGYQWTATLPFNSQQTTIYFGMANYFDNSFYRSQVGVAMYNSGTSQCGLVYEEGGSSIYISDASGTQYPVTAFTNPFNTWYYIELLFVAGPNSSTGSITMRQNGVQIFSQGMPTTITNNWFDELYVGSPGSGGSQNRADDLYIYNGQGIEGASFLGPMRVATLYPASDISSTGGWTPTSGTTLYNEISEATEDGATSTISTSTNAAFAKFSVTSLSGTIGDILGVQPVIFAMGSGSTVSSEIISSGNVESSNYSSLSVTFEGYSTGVVENDPATGEGWTSTGVNDMNVALLKGSP